PVDCSRHKRVTFNQGQTSVQIFPGGSVVSDLIHFKVKPGENLAVSIYFQDPSGAPPFLLEVGGPGPNYIPTHGGYVALDSGNRNSDVSFTVDPVQNISGRIWLSGIDVCQSSHSSGKTIACWGDSIILGTGSTADAHPNDKGFRVMAKAVKLKLFCIQN
ncbi:MAG: hypothetical protein LLG04_03685, partial [Parachlamydia sp.]|nr:hypothetical protein [Parachlamydia sp.]